MEYSYLCGYSYAWKAGYKPVAFKNIEQAIIVEKGRELILKGQKLADQIIDCYGKLGFLFLARDYIRKVNGKHPQAHIYIHYHLYNFIYDCKAFLDAVAVMLNSFYSIGKTGGDIDFKKSSFRNALTKKEPRLLKAIREFERWFLLVASWRDRLIHRFSTLIAPFISTDHWPSDEEMNALVSTNPPCVMLMEPRPYHSPRLSELKKKYGKETREIDPFCEEWITKACDLFDRVCNVISENYEQKAK